MGVRCAHRGHQLRRALVHPQGRPGHRWCPGRVRHRVGRLRRRFRSADTGRPRHHPLPDRRSDRVVHRDRNRDHARLPADRGTVPGDGRGDRGPTQRTGDARGGTPRAAAPTAIPPHVPDPGGDPCCAPGHRDARPQGARRAVAVPPRRGRRRAAEGGSPAAAGRAGHGRARELQRPARRPAFARPRRRGLVPEDGSRSARVDRASASCCTSSRRRTGPRSGWTMRRWSRHEGGYTPFEADITAPSGAGERARGSPSASTTR